MLRGGGDIQLVLTDLMKIRKLDFVSSFNISYQINLQLLYKADHLNLMWF